MEKNSENEDIKSRLYSHAILQNTSPVQAPEDLLSQTVKLACALTSGAFSKPVHDGGATNGADEDNNNNNNDEDENNPKYRMAPRMFKHVIGKGHVDFKTGQQQDAAQFLQYYLEQLDRSEMAKQGLLRKGDHGVDVPFYPASHLFSFATETRSVCTADQKVKYVIPKVTERETIWSIPIPMELAEILPASVDDAKMSSEGPDHKRHKAGSNHSESTASTQDLEKEEDEEESKSIPTISLEMCLDQWASETTVEDQCWPHLQGARHSALCTTRLANFPPYLFLQLQRYTLGPDWQPVKLQVNLSVPMRDDGTYVLDLNKYKSSGGPQPGESLVPDEVEGEASTVTTRQAAAAAQQPVIDEAALSQLMDMGFSLNSCKRALNAVGGSNIEAAMGWVFEHNTDPDFNDPLPEQPNSATTSASTGGPIGRDAVDEATVQSLVEMLGSFTADQIRFALKETNGASDRAADWLFSHMDDVDALMIASASNNEHQQQDGTPSSSPLLLPALEDSADSSRYQLTGIISHIGKHTGSGHYVCHLLVDGKWIIFNDDKVAESANPPVEHAYLYLFQRMDTLDETADLPFRAQY